MSKKVNPDGDVRASPLGTLGRDSSADVSGAPYHQTGIAAKDAIDFLAMLRPGGPWVLTAIIPDGATETTTATNADEVAAFVDTNNGKKNLYYSVNPTRTAMNKKAAKTDIVAIEYLLADLDPAEGESPEDAKARYLNTTMQPPCTAQVDSGNGIQGLWRLAEPIPLAEPITVKGKKVFLGETAALIADVEARQKAMMAQLGSAVGTQNIDRIMRLPGTTNLPNAKKLKAGRVSCPTKLLQFNGATCTLDDFPKAPENKVKAAKAEAQDDNLDWSKVAEHAGWLRSVADLPTDFHDKGRLIVGHGGTLKDLCVDLQQAGLVEKPYGSWSDVSMALAAILKADGRFTREQIAAALLCPLNCNQHVTKHKDEVQRKRAVERLLTRSHAARIARALPWRECNANGAPKPSLHNAMLAITALGIVCRHDTFHNTMLVGFKDDAIRHELQAVVGDVSDNAILRLRHFMSERFGIDFTTIHTKDAVITLALEHCFDPVRDMLTEAEGDWDGVTRLDAMAVDYFNCADTPLNRAFIRKMMIAAVRRARRPGCKFDSIVVLESDEGWDKSTSFLILAGEENFSDQSILGKKEQVIQETMAGVWIHESADLSGMKKAQVEEVKAFASRQADRGRPAYGHFPVKQKRAGINVGTTNDNKYLQSQTGNRRFWPLKVLKPIDTVALRRDRLQLWGEAAKYESAGESNNIPKALWAEAGKVQEQRRVSDPWEDILANMPKQVRINEEDSIPIVHVVDDKEFVASSDLLTHVLHIPKGLQTHAYGMRLCNVMAVLGWQRDSNKLWFGGKQQRGYWRWVVPHQHVFLRG